MRAANSTSRGNENNRRYTTNVKYRIRDNRIVMSQLITGCYIDEVGKHAKHMAHHDFYQTINLTVSGISLQFFGWRVETTNVLIAFVTSAYSSLLFLRANSVYELTSS